MSGVSFVFSLIFLGFGMPATCEMIMAMGGRHALSGEQIPHSSNCNVDGWQLWLLGCIVKEPISLHFPLFITIKRYSTNAAEDVWAARIWEKGAGVMRHVQYLAANALKSRQQNFVSGTIQGKTFSDELQ